MTDWTVLFHRGTSRSIAIAVDALSKRLPPLASLLLRVLIYVPDSHPFVTNVLRASDFLLLLINLGSGLYELVHDQKGCVSDVNLVLLLLYAVVHGLVVMLEMVKFVHRMQK